GGQNTHTKILKEKKKNPKKNSKHLKKPKNNPNQKLGAVKEGHQKEKKIKAIIKALTAKEIKDYNKKK
ncbi:hypothetical protein ACEE13_12320, partial [Staphylococcus simulans]